MLIRDEPGSGDMFAISIAIPPVAIAWAGLSILIGFLALAKRRSFIGWMAASILFTPFAAVVLFFLPRVEATPKTKAPAVPPQPQPAPPPLPASPSLFRRVAGAAKFRAKENPASKALAGAASVAHRSLENFASRAELEQDIKQSVQDRFGHD